VAWFKPQSAFAVRQADTAQTSKIFTKSFSFLFCVLAFFLYVFGFPRHKKTALSGGLW
jgi:hypothetical protein